MAFPFSATVRENFFLPFVETTVFSSTRAAGQVAFPEPDVAMVARGGPTGLRIDKTLAADPRFRGSDSGPLTSGAVFVDGHLESDADIKPFIDALEKLRAEYPTWEMFVNVYTLGSKTIGVFLPDGSPVSWHIIPLHNTASQPAASQR